MPRTNAIHALFDQIVAMPPEQKLEVAAALWSDPRPSHRRLAITIVVRALRELCEAEDWQPAMGGA